MELTRDEIVIIRSRLPERITSMEPGKARFAQITAFMYNAEQVDFLGPEGMLQGALEAVDDDGAEWTVEYEQGDDSVGIPSGWLVYRSGEPRPERLSLPLPIVVATALSLYDYNVQPHVRAQKLYDHFDGDCAELEDLNRILIQEPASAATALAYPTAAVYMAHALERYGQEAAERCAINAGASVRRCRKCGCTDDNACLVKGVPCHWVEDDLCSACVDK